MYIPATSGMCWITILSSVCAHQNSGIHTDDMRVSDIVAQTCYSNLRCGLSESEVIPGSALLLLCLVEFFAKLMSEFNSLTPNGIYVSAFLMGFI